MVLKQKKEFWITNTHPKKDILIEDLNLVIKAMESKNLLDEKHYNYTYDQIYNSLKDGSLRNKANFIKPRVIAPKNQNIKPGMYVSKNGRLAQPLRSAVRPQELKYEELDEILDGDSDEAFAFEQADDSYEEHRPVLAVDKRYTETPIDNDE